MSTVEDYLDNAIHGFIVRGYEATGDCPLCGKPRDHFYIHVGHELDSDGKSRHGRWICFSCGESGDFWKLLGELEGLSPARAKAWWVAQGREVAPPPTIARIQDRLRALRRAQGRGLINTGLPLGFTKIKRRRPRVLAQRGVSLRIARKYGLGYASEGEAAQRIIFPIRCPLGRSWTARAIGDATPKYYGGDGAGKLLYGWDVAFKRGKPSQLVVCEGPMDVLSLAEAGISSVAVMSKSLNDERASLLRRCGAELLVVLDSEARSEAVKVSSMLNQARVVFLESGDPGDTPPQILLSAVQGAITNIRARCEVNRNRINALRIRFSNAL